MATSTDNVARHNATACKILALIDGHLTQLTTSEAQDEALQSLLSQGDLLRPKSSKDEDQHRKHNKTTLRVFLRGMCRHQSTSPNAVQKIWHKGSILLKPKYLNKIGYSNQHTFTHSNQRIRKPLLEQAEASDVLSSSPSTITNDVSGSHTDECHAGGIPNADDSHNYREISKNKPMLMSERGQHQTAGISSTDLVCRYGGCRVRYLL